MGDDDRTRSGGRRLLIAAGAIVVILVAALALIHEMSASALLQDCVLSGRSNCAPIDAPDGRVR